VKFALIDAEKATCPVATACEASVDTSKPAMDGQLKTGHQESVRDW